MTFIASFIQFELEIWKKNIRNNNKRALLVSFISSILQFWIKVRKRNLKKYISQVTLSDFDTELLKKTIKKSPSLTFISFISTIVNYK